MVDKCIACISFVFSLDLYSLSVEVSLGPVYEFVSISFRTDNLNCFRAS